MKTCIAALLVLCLCCCVAVRAPWHGRNHDAGAGYVVLLHGLGRTSRSMSKMSRAMESAGYDVVNVSYPSTRGNMPELVGILEEVLARQCTDVSKRVHFVTHSLGGIIVRSYLDQQSFDRLGRVVMLAPPNGGSEIADTLKSWRPYQLAMGPMGQQLGTGQEDLPRSLGPVDFDVGVITGDRSMNPLYSWWVKGRDDGKVSVRNARLPGMRDFLVVHASHTFIMRRRQVIQQAIAFLQDGRFAR